MNKCVKIIYVLIFVCLVFISLAFCISKYFEKTDLQEPVELEMKPDTSPSLELIIRNIKNEKG